LNWLDPSYTKRGRNLEEDKEKRDLRLHQGKGKLFLFSRSEAGLGAEELAKEERERKVAPRGGCVQSRKKNPWHPNDDEKKKDWPQSPNIFREEIGAKILESRGEGKEEKTFKTMKRDTHFPKDEGKKVIQPYPLAEKRALREGKRARGGNQLEKGMEKSVERSTRHQGRRAISIEKKSSCERW